MVKLTIIYQNSEKKASHFPEKTGKCRPSLWSFPSAKVFLACVGRLVGSKAAAAVFFRFPERKPVLLLAKLWRVLYNKISCCGHRKDETMNNKVKVTIAGKNYVLNTDETERYTRMLAGKLDKDLEQVMQSDDTIGLTDSVILTALDYLDQYKKASDDADNLRGQLTNYIDDSNKLASKLEAAQKELKKQQQATRMEVAKAVEGKDSQIKELNELLENARQKIKELENQIGFMSLKEKLENGGKK